MAYQCSSCKNCYHRECMQGEPDCPRATDCLYYESVYVSYAPNGEEDDGNDWD